MIRYDRLIEEALKGVVRQILAEAAENGLPGAHHFYISFRTGDPGVDIADRLRARFPQEMTIVIQHQYWGLEAGPESFCVTLSFDKMQERLVIPYSAITTFADPSVQFGLQFQPSEAAVAAAEAADREAEAAAEEQDVPPPQPSGPAQVITLDKFRKK